MAAKLFARASGELLLGAITSGHSIQTIFRETKVNHKMTITK